MNMGGSTTLTPATDARVRAQPNHEGSATPAGINDASQNGLRPATYPPISDFANRMARMRHFRSVNWSLRKIASPTLQLSNTTAGIASAKRDKMSIAIDVVLTESTQTVRGLRRM